jgi:hypothetical protein
MALASLGLIALPYAAGGGLHVAAAVLVVLTVLAVRSPESLWVAGLLVGHAIHWTAAPTRLDDGLARLVGAWLALLVHVCASAAATWPSAAPMPRRALLRWGRRTATVALATVPVWGVSMLTRDQSLRGEVSMTFVALAALALLSGGVYLLARDAQAAPQP